MFDPHQSEWLERYREPSNYIPGQQEIKYFFPLTEQISLDLDFSNCDTRQRMLVSSATGTIVNTIPSASINVAPQWTTSTINVDVDNFKFTLNKKPSIIRRIAYKLLGIKWSIN